MAPFKVEPIKAGPPSAMARLANPLLPNGAPLKLTGGSPGARGTPGAELLFSRAKAPSAVMFEPIFAAVVNWPPASAALYWPMRAARTPVATAVLKQVGETPGARIAAGTPGLLAKLAPTRQLA